ncbi:hypothetical protein OKA06_00965 [Novosphingobium sp. MW5]|nr:hypothetical protein [Novosphingobium sp. MW5]
MMFNVRVFVIGAASIGWALMAFHNAGMSSVNHPPKALRSSGSGFVINPTIANQQLAVIRNEIRHEPLSAPALRDFALGIAKGQFNTSRSGLERAERVSRRDQWTQLFLIESSVQNGDIAGALRRYDTLLTLNGSLAPVLIDRLVAALISPDIRLQLPRYANRPWMLLLLDRAAQAEGDPQLALDLAKRTALLGPDLPDQTARNLVSAFITRGEPANAEAVADQLSDARHRGWRDTAFSAASTSIRLVPLTWDLAEGADISVTLAAPGILEVADISGKRAQVAARLQRLPLGATLSICR